MQIDMWFDPGCPFTWLTSRWIHRVVEHRDLEVTWRSFSLLVKNDPPESSPFHPKVRRTRDLLRVVEAVRDAGHPERVGELYTALGRSIHELDDLQMDVGGVLEGLSLDAGLALAADDTGFDAAIRSSMDEAIALAGPDVGVPIIGLDAGHGRVAFSGPVLTRLPDDAAALDLWDGFVLLAGTQSFWELKRTRTEGPNIPR